MPGLTITAPAVEGTPMAGRTQADLERAFERRARELGVSIRRGHRVVALSQTADLVEITAEQADGGRAVVTADYAVGADGARSAVRRLAGIPSDDHPCRTATWPGPAPGRRTRRTVCGRRCGSGSAPPCGPGTECRPGLRPEP